MTGMTPKRLMQAADHMEEIGYRHAALSLREAAAELKREQDAEQAAEKRIDEYAAVAYRAAGLFIKSSTEWDSASLRSKDAYRAMIRAVLAKRDAENEVPF